jgi:hypothetical protein
MFPLACAPTLVDAMNIQEPVPAKAARVCFYQPVDRLSGEASVYGKTYADAC